MSLSSESNTIRVVDFESATFVLSRPAEKSPDQCHGRLLWPLSDLKRSPLLHVFQLSRVGN